MNDRERELWVLNDEGLYWWWKESRLSLASFIRENREEITASIRYALGERECGECHRGYNVNSRETRIRERKHA